jgi:hypothetical protein
VKVMQIKKGDMKKDESFIKKINLSRSQINLYISEVAVFTDSKERIRNSCLIKKYSLVSAKMFLNTNSNLTIVGRINLILKSICSVTEPGLNSKCLYVT